MSGIANQWSELAHGLTPRAADAEHGPRLTSVCGFQWHGGSPAFWLAVQRGRHLR